MYKCINKKTSFPTSSPNSCNSQKFSKTKQVFLLSSSAYSSPLGGGVQESHSVFSSCFLGSTVSTGNCWMQQQQLHMVAELTCSFPWAKLLPLLTCIFLTQQQCSKPLKVKYLPGGIYLQRYRETCTGVGGTKSFLLSV